MGEQSGRRTELDPASEKKKKEEEGERGCRIE